MTRLGKMYHCNGTYPWNSRPLPSLVKQVMHLVSAPDGFLVFRLTRCF
jgi:hypothetical protein